MSLTRRGDNTYSNYAEANRAFWRQTVLPLVHRTANALARWLGPAWGSEITLRADLDQIEALSPEREALWARLEKAGFLTDDEKRAAVGYGGKGPGGGAEGKLATKCRPDQPRDDRGRWVEDGGGEGDGGDGDPFFIPVQERSGYPIDLLEEESAGGHTFARHVGKSEEYLKARILGSRRNIPLVGEGGEKRAGSFPSLEAADKLVNSTIAQNRAGVEAFARGDVTHMLPIMFVHADFDAPTGYEAYASNHRSQPVMRTTYGVTVFLVRSNQNQRGYNVRSAWPTNRD